MLWLPTLKLDVEQVACPEPLRACAPQPVMVAPPSLKFAVPVGVPAPGRLAVTVAVKVTLCPKTDGLADELTVVVVLAWFTVCVRTALVLVVKLPSPL